QCLKSILRMIELNIDYYIQSSNHHGDENPSLSNADDDPALLYETITSPTSQLPREFSQSIINDAYFKQLSSSLSSSSSSSSPTSSVDSTSTSASTMS